MSKGKKEPSVAEAAAAASELLTEVIVSLVARVEELERRMAETKRPDPYSLRPNFAPPFNQITDTEEQQRLLEVLKSQLKNRSPRLKGGARHAA